MSNGARLHPQTALEAAGYIRVSRKVQVEGHSPEIQRDAIKRLAAQEGYALAMIEEDYERGSTVTRNGYQRIIEAVRAGTVHVVLVYMFDRFGRDGAEWLARAHEFERLDVPIISVQEGRDEGGLMRFIRAGMAEQYSRQLASRVRPARERAAQLGIHMGVTPFGYKRVYPAHEGSHRQPAGRLVIDEATAWVVRDLYERYAAGGWSLRKLAIYLNSVPNVPRPRKQSDWSSNTLCHMMRNPVYCGRISYNVKRVGLYERSAEGAAFVTEGQHEPIVAVALWDAVQRRMDGAQKRRTYNSHQPTTHLATGLLRCAECGALLVATSMALRRKGQYYCAARGHGKYSCTAISYRIDLAHEALIAEVRRLRGMPWTPQAEERLSDGAAAEASQAAEVKHALDAERELMRRHTRRMSELEDDPTPEQIVAFREVGAEISARIRALEELLTSFSVRVAAVPGLRALHDKLICTEISDIVDALWNQGDIVGLRELLLDLVKSANVVERQPAKRSTWLRLHVTWTPDVQTLLDAGLLTLAEPVPAPCVLTARERDRERWRHRFGKGLRYRL